MMINKAEIKFTQDLKQFSAYDNIGESYCKDKDESYIKDREVKNSDSMTFYAITRASGIMNVTLKGNDSGGTEHKTQKDVKDGAKINFP